MITCSIQSRKERTYPVLAISFLNLSRYFLIQCKGLGWEIFTDTTADIMKLEEKLVWVGTYEESAATYQRLTLFLHSCPPHLRLLLLLLLLLRRFFSSVRMTPLAPSLAALFLPPLRLLSTSFGYLWQLGGVDSARPCENRVWLVSLFVLLLFEWAPLRKQWKPTVFGDA